MCDLVVMHGGEAACEVARHLAKQVRAMVPKSFAIKTVAMNDHLDVWAAVLASTTKPACFLYVAQTVENDAPAEEAGKAIRHYTKPRSCKFCSNTTAAAAAKSEHQERCGAGCPYVDEEGAQFGALDVAYAVVCIGDTNLLLDRQTTTAKDCNAAGQKLDKALGVLGGTCLIERCEANEAEGLELAIDPWTERFAAALKAKYAS